jgi:hypothetical protein
LKVSLQKISKKIANKFVDSKKISTFVPSKYNNHIMVILNTSLGHVLRPDISNDFRPSKALATNGQLADFPVLLERERERERESERERERERER